MAKFIFRMQNILDIKMRLETQAKTEFAECSAKVDAEEQKLRELYKQKSGYEEQIKEMSASKLDVAELRRLNDAMKVMQELMNKQAVNLRIAQRNLDRARARLNEAVQERKIYEKLKENAFEEFKLEINEEEKKEIDQLVSFTYNNRENGD